MTLREEEKYRLKIISIGEMAPEIFSEGLLIFFAKNAPGELQEVSIVHDSTELLVDIEKGDIIKIGDVEFEVFGVGAVVNDNLRNIGHMVLKFNGLELPENPGDINVSKSEVPPIEIGMECSILYG